MNYYKFFTIIAVLAIITIPDVKASEPIMITISGDMDKVIFDGKWSFYSEWKPSSLNTISYNDGELIQLRSAHQGNFVYILIDEISNTKFNKNSDKAMICFDKNDSKSMKLNENDYCFGVPLDSKTPFAFRGGSDLQNKQYIETQNPDGLITVGGISDENDRYSKIAHASYEFRVPTDVIGRSDDYGFYLAVYNTDKNQTYSWPQEITNTSLLNIPSPSNWGQMISPDKSLPEFPLPLLIIGISFFIVILARKGRLFKFR